MIVLPSSTSDRRYRNGIPQMTFAMRAAGENGHAVRAAVNTIDP
jgi:hypothetical protein